MIEHVGARQIDVYAAQVARLLRPGGRTLNQGIARLRVGDPEAGPFSERFVFPDVAPLHLSTVLAALERAGLVTEHVESFAGLPRPWLTGPSGLTNAARRRSHSPVPSASGFGGCTYAWRAPASWTASPASTRPNHSDRRGGQQLGRPDCGTDSSSTHRATASRDCERLS